jgi:hypothetical protein
MKARYFKILLALLIGLAGIFGHPAFAADCDDHECGTPIHTTNHAANSGHGHCACSLNTPQTADSACRLTILLQPSQKPFYRSETQRMPLSGLGPAALHQDRLSISNRLGLVRRLNKTESPLSHPIYLQTLALLC